MNSCAISIANPSRPRPRATTSALRQPAFSAVAKRNPSKEKATKCFMCGSMSMETGSVPPGTSDPMRTPTSTSPAANQRALWGVIRNRGREVTSASPFQTRFLTWRIIGLIGVGRDDLVFRKSIVTTDGDAATGHPGVCLKVTAFAAYTEKE